MRRELYWLEDMSSAFKHLKAALILLLVMIYSDFTKSFTAETDAFVYADGAILSQKDSQRKFQPGQYSSRTIKLAERNYSIYVKEALSMNFAFKKSHRFLLSTEALTLTQITKLRDPYL